MSTLYCWVKVSCFSFEICISILIQIYFCPNFKRTRAICDIWNKALSFFLQCSVNVIIKVTKKHQQLTFWLPLTKTWNIHVLGTSEILIFDSSVCFKIFFWKAWSLTLPLARKNTEPLLQPVLIHSFLQSFRPKPSLFNHCIQCAINLNIFERNLKSLTIL